MVQQIIAFALLAIALVYLAWKFFWPRAKKKSKKGCGTGDDCGCH